MAAGQTLVKYGDMTITNCLTQPGGFSQTPIFDESNTDLLYFKFIVRVVGYIHGIAAVTTVGILPNFGLNEGGNAGQPSAGIARLGLTYTVKPRQPFQYILGAAVNGTGGVAVLGCNTFQFAQSAQAGAASISNISGFDVNNGPRCTHFDVIHVTADNLLKVEAEFEICMVVCDSNGNTYNNSGVLNNRWSVMDDIDENYRTTRKFSGVLHTVSSTVNANSFRAYVVPPLQPGMRRDAMSFGTSEDGLKLHYEITDKEAMFASPAPATHWRIEHTEEAQRESRLSVYGNCRVEMQGDRNADHKVMIPIAIAAAEAKLLTKDNKTVIMGVTVGSVMGSDESMVTVAVRGMRVPKDGQALLGLPLAKLGKPIGADDLNGLVAGYNKDFSRGANANDVIEVQGPIQLVGAFAAYLQTNCDGYHQIWQTSAGQPSQNPPQTQQIAITGSTGGVANISDDGSTGYYNNASQTALYTFYQMETEYSTNLNRAHCPIAVTGSSSSSATGSQATSVVVSLAPPLTKRIIRVSSERAGTQPDLPAMPDTYTDSNGILFTLLDVVDKSIVPDRTADSVRMYKIDREYIYAMSRAPNANDVLTIGVNPWENAGAYTRQYDTGIEEVNYPIA